MSALSVCSKRALRNVHTTRFCSTAKPRPATSSAVRVTLEAIRQHRSLSIKAPARPYGTRAKASHQGVGLLRRVCRSPWLAKITSQPHCRQASTASDAELRRTSLYDLHVKNGGTMVPFGGYEMPVQYSDLSIGESHKWTREKASLFDVGHM